MRICVERATGRLIEMQSAAVPGALLANARAAGLRVADLEEREIAPEAFQALLAVQPNAIPSQFDALVQRVTTEVLKELGR